MVDRVFVDNRILREHLPLIDEERRLAAHLKTTVRQMSALDSARSSEYRRLISELDALMQGLDAKRQALNDSIEIIDQMQRNIGRQLDELPGADL